MVLGRCLIVGHLDREGSISFWILLQTLGLESSTVKRMTPQRLPSKRSQAQFLSVTSSSYIAFQIRRKGF